MRSTVIVSALLAASLAWLAPGPANANTVLPTIGGSGGGDFQSRCPGNPGDRYLIGVQVRQGTAVDRITIICAKVANDGKTHFDEARSQRNYGGEGGSAPIDRKCGGGMHIESIQVATTIVARITVVRWINFQCYTANKPSGVVSVGGSTGTTFPGQDGIQKCPAGEAAIGLHIRSGDYVDAVGLICHPFKSVAAPSQQSQQQQQQQQQQTPPSPLAKRIVDYAAEREKNQWCVDRTLATRREACPPLRMGAVGDGECTDLVAGALTFVNARFTNDDKYDWGKEIGRRTPSSSTGLNVRDIQPGDIVQYFNAKFVDPNNANNWLGTTSQHSAIVESNNNGVLTVLEQNTWTDCDSNGCKTNRRFVTRGTLNLNWTLTKNTGEQDARLIIYRAEQSQGFVASKSVQQSKKTSGWRRLAAVGEPQQRVRQCACATGYTHRLADARDYVCAPTATRDLIVAENKNAVNNQVSRSDIRCRSGFVWRDAFNGDGICVTPHARDRVHQENRQHVNYARCR